MYLFDTDTLSDLLKKQPSPALLKKLAQVPPEKQFTSAITAGELFYGAYKSPRKDYFLQKLEQVVWPRVQIISFDRKTAKTYGQLRADLERAGQPLSGTDLMIASIALTYNLTLVTGNIKHFTRVKGLRVEDWL